MEADGPAVDLLERFFFLVALFPNLVVEMIA